MCGVVRWSGAGGWLFPIGLLVFSLLPSGALAQSSVGRAANTATGASLLDAVEQQQNELIQSSGVREQFWRGRRCHRRWCIADWQAA